MKTNQSQNNIPSGWKRVTLGDLFDFKNGLNSEKANFGHGVRFINIMEILKYDFLTAENIPGRINVDPKRNKENIVEYGDVLFNRTSETPDEVGMTSVYLDTEPVVFGGFVIRAKPKTKELKDLYKKYCFSSENFRKEIIKNSQGVVRGNIGQGDLKVIPFLLPPKEEQDRIINVLETWNRQIEKLVRKIEIKKQIKKLLTNDLIKGKKRIEGFSENWNDSRLKDLLEETDERVGERKIKPVAVGVYGIRDRSDIFYKELSDNYSNNKVLRYGELCFGIGTREIVSDVLLEDKTYCVSPAYKIFKIVKSDPYFLDKYIDVYRKQISTMFMIVSARQGKSVDFQGLLKFKFKIPDLNEQKSIAKVLLVAEQEIIELEKKLVIIKEQKRYLLNNLTTGTIRTPETLSTKLTK